MSADNTPTGPDLSQGVALAELHDGKLVGHVGDEAVLLVRVGEAIHAVGAHCTHYQAPLADGLVVDGEIRCPWHHARFDLTSGEALCAPAFAPLTCWSVEQRDGKIFVAARRAEASASHRAKPAVAPPSSIVIVGAGAAGFAAAERLRREQFKGRIVMLGAENNAPLDRPNLSKDYLAGSAPEDWLPLKPDDFYAQHNIDLRPGVEVAALDLGTRSVTLASGDTISFDRLLLATGCEPIRLPTPGADLPHVFTLRSLADCRAIIARAASAKRVVVMGASFIGLEVAAALRARGLEVHVVAPEKRPMERVLGPQMGDFVRALHESHGVIFHLDDVATTIDATSVTLKSGGGVDADLVVLGVGVRPRLALAERAGLAIDRGVVVDAFLETSAPGVFAAGDIARWPDPNSGENIRVEHWVVAERQGQTAALNMLGGREAFTAAPFFWSQHYDVAINYVGHAESWDEIEVEGDIAGKDCLLRYKSKGRTLAVVSIFRDVESLRAELEMETAASAR